MVTRTNIKNRESFEFSMRLNGPNPMACLGV